MNSFEIWGQWIKTPLGACFLEQEQNWMDVNLEDIFGYNAIQTGPLQLDCLRSNRIQCKSRLCFDSSYTSNSLNPNFLLVSPQLIPIESQSIDLFVISHVLETVENPHQFLREVERVLIPEGKIIISAFNPVSLWSLNRKFNKASLITSSGAWIAINRLKDWCELLNLKIVGGEFSTYIPPINSETWIKRFFWMENAGARWWPTAGAVYYLTAIKRNSGVKLIGSKKWKTPKFKKQTAASIGKTII